MTKKMRILTAAAALLAGVLLFLLLRGEDSRDSQPTDSDAVGTALPTIESNPSAGELPGTDAASSEGPEVLPMDGNAYALLREEGYSGTEEEWIASLVGENYPGETENAYDLAVKKGYRGSYDRWIRTVTGWPAPEQIRTAYQVAREHGEQGSLAEWLTTLVCQPEALGHAADGSTTEYERACKNGYQGTFIEWIVSLVGLN